MDFYTTAVTIKKDIKLAVSKTHKAQSIIMVNTGNGKGKTTAAIGTLIRAKGYDHSCALYQFLKGDVEAGEIKILRTLAIKVVRTNCPCLWNVSNKEQAQAECQRVFQEACLAITGGQYNLIVLDELTYLIEVGFIELNQLLTVLTHRSPRTSVIITGRNAPKELIELADTVSSIDSIKHAFDNNIAAIKGVDY